MGPETLRVNRHELHGTICSKVVAKMRESLPEDKRGIVLLQGGGPWTVYSSDMDSVFRQESYFHYLFGVENENFYGAIDLRTGRSMLFMPRLPPEHAVWMGPIDTPEEVREKYCVDEVHYVDDLASVLAESAPPVLHTLVGVNSDSSASTQPAEFKGIEAFEKETDSLHTILTEARVIKTPEEIRVLEFANEIASAGHIQMMRECKPGMMEYQLESVFLNHCYREGGCRHAPYTPICGSGPNAAVLHYGHAGAPNNRRMLDGDLVLCDMGCEYHGYDSDITTTFPVNGKFTDDQKLVYNAVLTAHKEVIRTIKPGISWPAMHRLAHKTMLQALKAGGLLQGEVDAMMRMHVGALFMPCGLGHFIGLDTHDVGGYLPGHPPRIMEPGIKHLRTARVLQEGMVITVEPGIYFNRFLLDPALEDPALQEFFIKDRILSFMSIGGVRHEDCVVVTADGCRSLSNVPREVEEVEAVMAGAPWPPLGRLK